MQPKLRMRGCITAQTLAITNNHAKTAINQTNHFLVPVKCATKVTLKPIMKAACISGVQRIPFKPAWCTPLAKQSAKDALNPNLLNSATRKAWSKRKPSPRPEPKRSPPATSFAFGFTDGLNKTIRQETATATQTDSKGYATITEGIVDRKSAIATFFRTDNCQYDNNQLCPKNTNVCRL